MHPRSDDFPGFTSAQIEAGLTTPVCEVAPHCPFADEFEDIEAAWGDEEDTRQRARAHLDDLAFAGDALGVAAAEYVAAQARVEPFWKALLGAVGVFIAAFGLCAWAAMAQPPPQTVFPPGLQQYESNNAWCWRGAMRYSDDKGAAWPARRMPDGSIACLYADAPKWQ